MDPATWTVLGLVALASFLYGCEEDNGADDSEGVPGGGDGYNWVDNPGSFKDVITGQDVPAVEAEIVEETADDSDVYIEEPGFNRRFMRFPKEVVDVDVYGSNVVALLKEPLEGADYVEYAMKSTDDPNSLSDPELIPASARQIGISHFGEYEVLDVVPQQIIWGGTGNYESSFIVPFANKADELGFCRSGISMTDPDGTYTSIVSPFTFVGWDTNTPETWTPCNVKSAVIVEKGEGEDPEIWMPATTSTEYGTVAFLKACTLPGGYVYKLTSENCNTAPVFPEQSISGQSDPSAIALLPYNMGDTDDPTLVVLDKMGIRIIKANFIAGDLDPDQAGYQDSYVDTIKTGTGDLPSLKEVPLTADGELVVIVSGSYLMKIKMKQRSVGGSVELQNPTIHHEDIADLIVKGGKVYFTSGESVHIFKIFPNDHDAKPEFYTSIPVGSPVSSLDVDDNGIVYVVTEDDENGGWTVTSIDPEIAGPQM